MTKILTCQYRSQRVNAEYSSASCNVTSAVMVLDASGHPPSEMPGLTPDVAGAPKLIPEDYLTRLGDSDEAIQAMRTVSPWFIGSDGQPTVRPPESPLMLDWIVQRAYGAKLIKYASLTPAADAIRGEVDAGRAIVLRGKFAGLGHIIAAVGYVLDDSGNLVGVVVDDPWGNVLTQYASHAGEHVVLPFDFYEQAVASCHFVCKGGTC